MSACNASAIVIVKRVGVSNAGPGGTGELAGTASRDELAKEDKRHERDRGGRKEKDSRSSGRQ